MIVRLKACPFCGGNATLQREYFELSEDELFYVRCEDCGGYSETPEEAIKAWNQRVLQPDLLEACVYALNASEQEVR